MSQRLKSWESPRNEGRNDKGKGGSARQRQKRKQFQMLRKKLKGETKSIKRTKRDGASVISFCLNFYLKLIISRDRNLLSRVWITDFMKISLTENRILKLVMFKL